MNINNIVKELERLKTHFTRVPNRIYSENKILEKEKILNELLTAFRLLDQVDPKINELIQKLVKDIKGFLIEQRQKSIKTMEKIDFLKLASSTLRSSFSGDPLKLTAFIDSIELLESLADSNELKEILITFIKTRLEGRAREIINTKNMSITSIKNDLKSNIRAESSKVVEGKLTALRTDRMPLQDFSDKVDQLAEGLQRSLVMEGISLAKASSQHLHNQNSKNKSVRAFGSGNDPSPQSVQLGEEQQNL